MKIRLLNFVLATALCSCAFGADAGPLSEWRDIGEFQQRTSSAGLAAEFQDARGLSTGFETPAGTTGEFTLAGETALAADAASQSDSRARAQSSTSSDAGSIAPVNASLWNFIWNVRAQQSGNQFQALETSSANIDYTLNSVPAPVPLPGSFWLFLAGLVAFVALRSPTVRDRGRERACAAGART